ncbi:hypothetical protein EHS14_01555 [Schaalia georgiae]|nr:hypothetical protein EHS14_01555 [Schaalia georgiae]
MKDARAQIVVIDDHRVVGFITIISGPQLIPPWDSPFGMAQWAVYSPNPVLPLASGLFALIAAATAVATRTRTRTWAGRGRNRKGTSRTALGHEGQRGRGSRAGGAMARPETAEAGGVGERHSGRAVESPGAHPDQSRTAASNNARRGGGAVVQYGRGGIPITTGSAKLFCATVGSDSSKIREINGQLVLGPGLEPRSRPPFYGQGASALAPRVFRGR